MLFKLFYIPQSQRHLRSVSEELFSWTLCGAWDQKTKRTKKINKPNKSVPRLRDPFIATRYP